MSLLPDSVDNSPQHVISARRVRENMYADACGRVAALRAPISVCIQSRRSSFGVMTNDQTRFRYLVSLVAMGI